MCSIVVFSFNIKSYNIFRTVSIIDYYILQQHYLSWLCCCCFCVLFFLGGGGLLLLFFYLFFIFYFFCVGGGYIVRCSLEWFMLNSKLFHTCDVLFTGLQYNTIFFYETKHVFLNQWSTVSVNPSLCRLNRLHCTCTWNRSLTTCRRTTAFIN